MGILLSTAGLTLAGFGAWVGGRLVYGLGTGVSRVAFEPRVEDFVLVGPVEAFAEGELTPAEVGIDGQTIRLVVVKRGTSLYAINATCTRVGANLAEGKLIDDLRGMSTARITIQPRRRYCEAWPRGSGRAGYRGASACRLVHTPAPKDAH